MQIDFITEEPSAEVFLLGILPRIVPRGVGRRVISHQGKGELLKKLGHRLKGYAEISASRDIAAVVLVDKDHDDCRTLKADLERIATESGALSRSRAEDENYLVANRIVVTNLESWILGFPNALVRAYPRLRTVENRLRGIGQPETPGGGSTAMLLKLLRLAGYDFPRLPKIEVARKVSLAWQQADRPEENRCQSFIRFSETVAELLRRVG